MPLKAVLFDMDGVIVDTEPLHRKAYFQTFKDLKIKVSEEFYTSLTGTSTKKSTQMIKDEFNLDVLPEEIAASKRKYFKQYFDTDPDFDFLGVNVKRVMSGPLGGDQQLGSIIAEGEIDIVIFFWDPMEAQPHDSDVKALLRLCVVWNIPMACDAATADFILTSPFMHSEYVAEVPDYTSYLNRNVVKKI